MTGPGPWTKEEAGSHIINRLPCQWFAKCGNPATVAIPHPILGHVPACDECNAWAKS